MLNHQGVAQLEKDEEVWPYWGKCSTRVGLWGFKTPSQTDCQSLSAYGPGCSSHLLLQLLPTRCHDPHHDDGLNPGKGKQGPNSMLSFRRIASVTVSLHSSRTVTRINTLNGWLNRSGWFTELLLKSCGSLQKWRQRNGVGVRSSCRVPVVPSSL